MNAGDLFIVKKEELLYGYIFNDINRKSFIRVKVEKGAYLIIEDFPDNFYEILVNKKLVTIKCKDKISNEYS